MSTAPETFTLFPTLPLEIRLKIWRSTFPGPRNVGLKMAIKNFGFGGWVRRNLTPPPPIALQICHESREEALKHYTLSFGTEVYPATVYFNHSIDTLCFGDGVDVRPERTDPSDYLLNLWHGKTFYPYNNASRVILMKNVRFIALDADPSIYGRLYFCWDEIRQFEELEELVLIVWDGEAVRESRMEYFKKAMRMIKRVNPEWVVPRTLVVDAEGREWGSLTLGQDVDV